MKISRLVGAVVNDRIALGLFVVSLAIYVSGIGWGLPYATGPDRVFIWSTDDISPLGPLTEVYQTFVKAGPNAWFAYPLAHYFILFVAYGPYLAWLFLTGQLKSPGAIYPFGMEDPVATLQSLTLIARVASSLMAAGIVVSAYSIGRTLWGKKEGIISAIICLSSYQMLYYSRTANLEIPYLFWTCLALVIYAKILVNGVSIKRASLFGAFAAMAVATKDQAAGIFLLLPLVLIPILIKDWKARNVRPWYPTLCFAGAGVLVYAVASGLALDPRRYLAHLNFIFNTNQAHIGAKYTHWSEPTLAGMTALTGKFFEAPVLVLGPVILLFGCIAVVRAAWNDRRRLALLLPVASYLVTMILPMRYMNLRYAMPTVFIVAIFAGAGLASGFNFLSRSKLATASVLVIALAWPLFLTFDLAVRMRTDSRYDAEKWMSEHVRPNANAGYLGSINSLPRLRADVQLTSVPHGTSAFEFLQTNGPEFLIVVPDWTSDPGMQYSKLCPEDLYQRLNDGSLGYTLTKTFEPHYLINRQLLDYPTVSPPVRIFAKTDAHSLLLHR